MLSGGDFLTEFALVCSRDLVANKLLASMRILPFSQPSEVFRFHGPGKLPLLGKLTLPFAVALLVAAPVILFLGGKLTFVISSRLAGRERFRDGKHDTNTSFLDSVGAGKCKEVGQDFVCFLELHCVGLITDFHDGIGQQLCSFCRFRV